MESPIKVAVRIHQPTDGNGNVSEDKAQNGNEDNGFVYTVPANADCYMTGFVQVGENPFTVKHALPKTCNNSYIFYQTVYPLISWFLEGYDASVVTYGQKGMGKTYTLYGQALNNEYGDAEQGVVQHSVREIYAHVANNADRICAISVGWIAICQDTIRDLLGVGNIVCKDVNEVFHWLQVGLNEKAATEKLEPSVHSLFTITLEQQWISKEGLLQHRLSTASFSDLAASDRIVVGNPINHIERMSIPKDIGLRALEQIVYTLTDPPTMYSVNGNIPYNQTALTTLLKDSIGGRAQTLVILCVSALETDAEETISNLKFAFKLQCVRNFVVMNTFSDNNTPVIPGGGVGGVVGEPSVPGLVAADNFGLQFAASQWLKLVSNAEGLFSKLVSNNSISQLEKEQISEWLFLKQECEECLSSNEVLRSQKQLRPIQETEEPEETLSEPDVSCQQNSDNESDVDSQRADLSERLETLMEELQLKTDLLVKEKYEKFMQRPSKPALESFELLKLQKLHEKTNEDMEERRASTGGRRRSIIPGSSLSDAELIRLNAACEQSVAPAGNNLAASTDFSLDSFGSIDIKPLRGNAQKSMPTPVEIAERKLAELDGEIKAKTHAIEELKKTILFKQETITILDKNSDTRSKAKERLEKQKYQLEMKREKAKKKIGKGLLQGKEKLKEIQQRLVDLKAREKDIDSATAQKRELEQSLQKSKEELIAMVKELKRDQKQRDQLASELKSLKDKEGDQQQQQNKNGNEKTKLQDMQARISHLNHVLREKSERLGDVGADNASQSSEALRHEINNLRLTKDQIQDERSSLSEKLKRHKKEERELLTCQEAIEAIDAVIEFKNELMVGHKSIDLSERSKREKGEQMLMARLNRLSVEEMRTLLYKYFMKVIDLRDSMRELETQLKQLEDESDTWRGKEQCLLNAVLKERLKGEQIAVMLQHEHERKFNLMLQHINDETSLSSSSFSDHYQPNAATAAKIAQHGYFNTANLDNADYYRQAMRSKMLKHGECNEICPSLRDAVTKYKPLDKIKDKHKLQTKIQHITRHAAGHSYVQSNLHSHSHSHNSRHTIAQEDDNGNALQRNAAFGGVVDGAVGFFKANPFSGFGGGGHSRKSDKDRNHKDMQLAALEGIPHENLKLLNATPTTAKPTPQVTISKKKLVIQDPSRKN